MKFAKSTLCAAIATSVFAASVQAEVTTIDPSLKLTYKNYYWKQEDTGASPYDRDSWVHGIVADFDTGYINDAIGVVTTIGAADKLAINGTSITNLAVSSDPSKKGEDAANGIAGFQQAYLKGKFNAGGAELKGSLGVKQRGYELYGNSGSRILGASSNGVDLAVKYNDLNLYGSQITGASNRNDSAFINDLTNGSSVNAQKIDHVRIIGANYTIAGVDLTAEHLVVQETLKKNFFKAAYTFDLDGDLSLSTDVRYGTAKKAGDLLGSDNDNGTANDKTDDFFEVTDSYKSSYYNLNAKLNVSNAYVGVGYNEVKDGDWNDFVGSDGNAGSFNSSASLWADFSLEGEKAYILSTGYNFADHGLPGLNADFYYATSKDAKNYSDFDRQEFSSYISYEFSGELKGLSLAWLHVTANYDGYEGGENTLKARDRSDRLYLKYSVSVF